MIFSVIEPDVILTFDDGESYWWENKCEFAH